MHFELESANIKHEHLPGLFPNIGAVNYPVFGGYFTLDFASAISRRNMDKRTSDRRKQRLKRKQLAPIFLFIAVTVVFYWLSFRVFTATDCEFFGSKIALIIVPACAAVGNQGAAALPFIIATASLVMAFLSLRQYRNLTRRSKGRAASGAPLS